MTRKRLRVKCLAGEREKGRGEKGEEGEGGRVVVWDGKRLSNEARGKWRARRCPMASGCKFQGWSRMECASVGVVAVGGRARDETRAECRRSEKQRPLGASGDSGPEEHFSCSPPASVTSRSGMLMGRRVRWGISGEESHPRCCCPPTIASRRR
jgi:hypothetical protein